jgi:uncharacterized repeat protein (TIGR01451 family)
VSLSPSPLPTSPEDQPLTWGITVANNNATQATNVQLVDTLPLGVTLINADPPPASMSTTNGHVVLTFPALPTLTQRQPMGYSISAQPAGPGQYTNTASVALAQIDLNPNNNTLTQTTTVLPVADMGLTVKATTDNQAGKVSYDITVTNNGPSTALGATVTDTIPSNSTLVSPLNDALPGSRTVTVPVGDLKKGDTGHAVIVVRPTEPLGTLSNAASAGSLVINHTPQTVTTPTDLAVPDLALSGSNPSGGLVGQDLTYAFHVVNNGNVKATGVTVTATLPAGAGFVGETGGGSPQDGMLSVGVPDLAPGASADVSVVVTPDAPLSLSIPASVTCTGGDFNDRNDTAIETAIVGIAVDLRVTDDALTMITLGADQVYTLTVTNHGPSTATAVLLTDTLPANADFVSATGGLTPINGKIVFSALKLAVGSTLAGSIEVRPRGPGALNNHAVATAVEPDPTGKNTLDEVTQVTAPLDLIVTGSVPDSVPPGGDVNYTLTVTNNGPSPAYSVTLTDKLPSGADFVSATSGGTPSNGVLRFNLGILPVNGMSSVTIVVRPSGAGTLLNQASVDDAGVVLTSNHTVQQTTNVIARVLVTVANVRPIGSRTNTRSLVLTFTAALDPAPAKDVLNYQVTAVGGPRRGKPTAAAHVRVVQAVVDASRMTVILLLAKKLDPTKAYQLSITTGAPGGLTDAAGRFLGSAAG